MDREADKHDTANKPDEAVVANKADKAADAAEADAVLRPTRPMWHLDEADESKFDEMDTARADEPGCQQGRGPRYQGR